MSLQHVPHRVKQRVRIGGAVGVLVQCVAETLQGDDEVVDVAATHAAQQRLHHRPFVQRRVDGDDLPVGSRASVLRARASARACAAARVSAVVRPHMKDDAVTHSHATLARVPATRHAVPVYTLAYIYYVAGEEEGAAGGGRRAGGGSPPRGCYILY